MDLQEHDLAGFYGTENWYRHGLRPSFLYTDGVKYMADHGEAYWLIDAIASHQPALRHNEHADMLECFQCWELKLDGNGGAVLTCKADSGMPSAVEQKIPFTDFPFDIKMWVEGTWEQQVLLLPSEH